LVHPTGQAGGFLFLLYAPKIGHGNWVIKGHSKKRNPPARQDLAGGPANRIILLSKVNSRLNKKR